MSRTFGQNVRIAMARVGITKQVDLAKRMKAAEGQVSGWLDAENVELKTVLRFAKTLGVPVTALVDGIDDDYDVQQAHADTLTQLQDLVPRLNGEQQWVLVSSARVMAGLPIVPRQPQPQTAPPDAVADPPLAEVVRKK